MDIMFKIKLLGIGIIVCMILFLYVTLTERRDYAETPGEKKPKIRKKKKSEK